MHNTPEVRILYRKLRIMIEKKLGVSIHTPKDFAFCRDAIFEDLRVNVSISTLKRFWGYVPTQNDYRPNRYTLNSFSKFVGYKDWDAFCSANHIPELGEHEELAVEELLNRIDRYTELLHTELQLLRALLYDKK